jgi:hypothetical protein
VNITKNQKKKKMLAEQRPSNKLRRLILSDAERISQLTKRDHLLPETRNEIENWVKAEEKRLRITT